MSRAQMGGAIPSDQVKEEYIKGLITIGGGRKYGEDSSRGGWEVSNGHK